MLLLCRELKNFITQALSDLPLQTKSGALRTPAVHCGWLPQTEAGQSRDDAFPFVTIRPLTGADTRESGFADIGIFIGAWSKDDAGWQDCMNVLNRIRIALGSLSDQTFPQARLTEGPGGKIFEWELYDEQAWPQWFALVTVHFEIGRSEPLIEKTL